MLRGAAATKAPLARAGASDRSQVPSALSANTIKPSRLLNSQTPDQRFGKVRAPTAVQLLVLKRVYSLDGNTDLDFKLSYSFYWSTGLL